MDLERCHGAEIGEGGRDEGGQVRLVAAAARHGTCFSIRDAELQ